MPKAKPVKPAPTIEDRAREIVRLKDRGRFCYREADRKLAELVALGVRPGDVIHISKAQSVKLRDNMPDGETTAFCKAYFRRYELD